MMPRILTKEEAQTLHAILDRTTLELDDHVSEYLQILEEIRLKQAGFDRVRRYGENDPQLAEFLQRLEEIRLIGQARSHEVVRKVLELRQAVKAISDQRPVARETFERFSQDFRTQAESLRLLACDNATQVIQLDLLEEEWHKSNATRRTIRALPRCVFLSIFLLPKQDREEILADLEEWWYQELENNGSARIYVAGKILSAYCGQALNKIDRMAGIVGKLWGRQKG